MKKKVIGIKDLTKYDHASSLTKISHQS